MFTVYLGTRKSLVAKNGFGRYKIAKLFSQMDFVAVAHALLNAHPDWDFVQIFRDQEDLDDPLFALERGCPAQWRD
jgi:hypothetical protein